MTSGELLAAQAEQLENLTATLKDLVQRFQVVERGMLPETIKNIVQVECQKEFLRISTLTSDCARVLTALKERSTEIKAALDGGLNGV